MSRFQDAPSPIEGFAGSQVDGRVRCQCFTVAENIGGKRVVKANVSALATSLRGLDEQRELLRLAVHGEITLIWVRHE